MNLFPPARLAVALTLLVGALPGVAAPIEWGVGAPQPYEGPEENAPWKEDEVRLPEFPRADGLIPFEVSAATRNRFAVDPKSLSVGKDRVVRYTLVIDTPSGARNVAYEGLRCDTKQRRLYATGRADATWARSRDDSWRDVVGGTANSAQAVLFREYFCPQGAAIIDSAEGVDALKRGGHPLLEQQ